MQVPAGQGGIIFDVRGPALCPPHVFMRAACLGWCLRLQPRMRVYSAFVYDAVGVVGVSCPRVVRDARKTHACGRGTEAHRVYTIFYWNVASVERLLHVAGDPPGPPR